MSVSEFGRDTRVQADLQRWFRVFGPYRGVPIPGMLNSKHFIVAHVEVGQ